MKFTKSILIIALVIMLMASVVLTLIMIPISGEGSRVFIDTLERDINIPEIPERVIFRQL